MDSRAVGIFDSGLGGLTAVKALRRLMPGENIVYLADSARVPYGKKSPEEIRFMTRQCLDFLSGFDVKVILAACGTVSSNTKELSESYPVKNFGVIESAVRELSLVKGEGPLGVIATEASIKSGVYQAELKKLCPGRQLICTPCPEFVALVESGHSSAEDSVLMKTVEEKLSAFKAAGVSGLLLGCTHFGIISEAIARYMGEGTVLVDAAAASARELRDYLIAGGLECPGEKGSLRCFTSGCTEDFSRLSAAFLGEEPEAAPEHISFTEVQK